jgi:hypothetical protein
MDVVSLVLLCNHAATCIIDLQAKREQMLVNIGLAEQRNDLARIADLKYGALPEVDNRLKALRDAAPKANAMLTGNDVHSMCTRNTTLFLRLTTG